MLLCFIVKVELDVPATYDTMEPLRDKIPANIDRVIDLLSLGLLKPSHCGLLSPRSTKIVGGHGFELIF